MCQVPTGGAESREASVLFRGTKEAGKLGFFGGVSLEIHLGMWCLLLFLKSLGGIH